MILSETSNPTKPDGPRLPSSLHYEKGALGCILLDGESDRPVASERLGQLKPFLFFDLRNSAILNALQKLEAKGDSLDVISTIRMLGDDSNVESFYLADLPNQIPSSNQFPQYLKSLKDTRAKRNIKAMAETAQKLVTDENTTPEEILSGLSDQISVIREQSHSSSAEFPQIINAEELLSLDIPVPSVLIQGVLRQGCKLLLSGGSKQKKTWCLQDMAISVAKGDDWMGFKTKQCNVLYINLEIVDYDFQQRLKDVSEAKGGGSLSCLDVLNLRGHSVDISHLKDNIIAASVEKEYGLIIFDPIYKLYGDRDENSSSDMADMFIKLEMMARETGAAIVFAAHQTKGNQASKASIDRIAGSGVFARDVDAMLIFTSHEQEDCFTVSPILRNMPPLTDFVVEWDFPLMRRKDDMNPERLKLQQNGNRSHHYTPEDILPHVPHDQPIAKNVLKENANQNGGIPLNKFNTLIDEAVEKGLLYVHLIKRPGTNPLKQIARNPQELQRDLNA